MALAVLIDIKNAHSSSPSHFTTEITPQFLNAGISKSLFFLQALLSFGIVIEYSLFILVVVSKFGSEN